MQYAPVGMRTFTAISMKAFIPQHFLTWPISPIVLADNWDLKVDDVPNPRTDEEMVQTLRMFARLQKKHLSWPWHRQLHERPELAHEVARISGSVGCSARWDDTQAGMKKRCQEPFSDLQLAHHGNGGTSHFMPVWSMPLNRSRSNWSLLSAWWNLPERVPTCLCSAPSDW